MKWSYSGDRDVLGVPARAALVGYMRQDNISIESTGILIFMNRVPRRTIPGVGWFGRWLMTNGDANKHEVWYRQRAGSRNLKDVSFTSRNGRYPRRRANRLNVSATPQLPGPCTTNDHQGVVAEIDKDLPNLQASNWSPPVAPRCAEERLAL